MIDLKVHIDGDNCWPDLRDRPVAVGELVGVARLPKGTVNGASTVTFRIELADGTVVLSETTLNLLRGAMRAFEAAESGRTTPPKPPTKLPTA